MIRAAWAAWADSSYLSIGMRTQNVFSRRWPPPKARMAWSATRDESIPPERKHPSSTSASSRDRTDSEINESTVSGESRTDPSRLGSAFMRTGLPSRAPMYSCDEWSIRLYGQAYSPLLGSQEAPNRIQSPSQSSE